MKQLLTLTALLASVMALTAAFPTRPDAAPVKRALIVAVGNYPAASGWMRISSKNDVPLVRNALLHQGFAAANIQVLQDSMATKVGIVAALTALAARTQPGDVVVVHYSGHGQQVADDNGDESDGLDEALVPYDAQWQFEPGKYEGQNHLRDDQLGALLGAIRQRAGRTGEVLTVIDACHSGTGTRGLARARGTFQVMAPPGYQPALRPGAPAAFGADEGDKSNAATAAPLVCYFGASPNQLNFETFDPQGHGVGSLSLAFSRSLTAATAPTYAGLFDRIRGEMASTAPNQTPQMEGPTNGQVFRGQTVAVPTHYRTSAGPDERTVLVDGGTLHGLYQGAELAFYPPDTDIKPTTKPLATGQLTYAELSRSTVRLSAPLPGPKPTAWAVVTRQSFGSQTVRLRVDLPAGPLLDSVQAAVRRRPFVQLAPTGPADLLLEMNKPAGNVQLLTTQEQKLYSAPAAGVSPGQMARAVLDATTAMSQTKYLKLLKMDAPDVAVKLRLMPVTTRMEGPYRKVEKQLDPESKRNATRNLVYCTGDYMQLELTNKGTKAAYFTVLDIQPDNQMAVLLPRENQEATDFVLQAGETRVLPNIYHISPPLGEEVIKVVAADTPIDLRPVVANRGTGQGRGFGNPFATLLADTYKNGDLKNRGSDPEQLEPETVSVDEVVYTIAAPPTN